MKQNQGGLLAFNNFLSTSKDRNASMRFLNRSLDKTNMINILFVMRIDSSIDSTPFANIKDVSYCKREEEVLFSMHSVFRIGQIKKIDSVNQIWEVELTLTSDNDPQLRALTEQMQKETYSSDTGWHRLGNLLIKIAQYDKAKELYELLLTQTNDRGEKALLFHQLGRINHDEGKYAEAVEYYGKSLEIMKKTLPENHPDSATSYSNTAFVYEKITDYKKALEYFQRALNIKQRSLPPNHPSIENMKQSIEIVKKKL